MWKNFFIQIKVHVKLVFSCVYSGFQIGFRTSNYMRHCDRPLLAWIIKQPGRFVVDYETMYSVRILKVKCMYTTAPIDWLINNNVTVTAAAAAIAMNFIAWVKICSTRREGAQGQSNVMHTQTIYLFICLAGWWIIAWTFHSFWVSQSNVYCRCCWCWLLLLFNGVVEI